MKASTSPIDPIVSGSPPGIINRVPPGSSAHRRVAIPLATLAEPPNSSGSPAWQRRVIALCRAYWAVVSEQDPDWRSTPGAFLPEELEFPKDSAQKILSSTLNSLNKGLGGAHALAFFYTRAMGRTEGDAAGPSTRLRSPRPLLEREIERVLWHEAEHRPVIEAKFGDKVLPRLPAPDAESAVKNVASRIVRPLLPVRHLLVAYAVEVERMEKAMATIPEAAARLGFRMDTAPRFTWFHLTLFPEWMDRMILTAQALEQATPFLEITHASEDQLVRLRLG